MIEAKLISSTNPVYNKMAGMQGNICNFNGSILFGPNKNPFEGSPLVTSMILSFTQDCNQIEFKTLNSFYVFELTTDEEFEFEISKKALELKEIMDKENSIKAKQFYCSVEAPSEDFLLTFTPIISFEEEVTRLEALDLIVKDDVMCDEYGLKVTNIYEIKES